MNKLRLLAVGIAVTSGLVQAATVDVTASNQGRYGSDGSNLPISNNYIAGQISGAGIFRNYFVFNLSSLSGTATAASLRLFQPSTGSISGFDSGYSSPDSTETYALYDVSTAISSLIAAQSSATSTYNDLGAGTQFGTITVGTSSNGTTLDIVLNSAGLAAVNAAIGVGNFAIGGALTTISGGSHQYMFGNTHVAPYNVLQSLRITTGDGGGGGVTEPPPSGVPEPGTIVTLGAGLIAIGVARFRKR